jgi:hypothetical protein
MLDNNIKWRVQRETFFKVAGIFLMQLTQTGTEKREKMGIIETF